MSWPYDRQVSRWIWKIVGTSLVMSGIVGCSTDPSSQQQVDSGQAEDVAEDTGEDASTETGVPTDVGSDGGPDTGVTDTGGDVVRDAGSSDGGLDAAADVPQDVESSSDTSDASAARDVIDAGRDATDVAPEAGMDSGLPPNVDCVRDSQCASGVCREGSCVPGTCSDGIQNQDETDVDCGGSACGPCTNGQSCQSPGDCQSGNCDAGTCEAATCSDGLRNQQETDVDCGGPNCGPCPNGEACQKSGDCQSGVCLNGVCSAPSCNDGILNNQETDVDCGGPNCPSCPNGSTCGSDSDCQNVCSSAGNCVTCNNGDSRTVTGGSCGYQQRGTESLTQTCQSNQWSTTNTTCNGVYYKSCSEIDAAKQSPSNGTYTLDPDGPGSGSSNVAPYSAYCQMSYNGSPTGGWTLVMKVDGTTSQFFYSDTKWVNDTLYNSSSLQPFNGVEAKLQTYLDVSFTQVHIVMETTSGGSPVTNSLSVYGQANSMKDLIGPGQYVPTYVGRSAWLGLMPNPSIQSNCNREGFNVTSGSGSVRIGLTGNNETNCLSADSYIGVGGTDPSYGPSGVSAGWWRGYDFGTPGSNGSEAAEAVIFVE